MYLDTPDVEQHAKPRKVEKETGREQPLAAAFH